MTLSDDSRRIPLAQCPECPKLMPTGQARCQAHDVKAEVEKTTVRNRYRAYCEAHQDGWNGTKRTAEKWATEHNNEHHKDA
ncbi:hypothetical protein HYP71_gp065 [Arthrobacter phage KBurrousTX]|uniref:Uncharacterized protein n=1 Tax=Arthrobacter phage KBurrousTX TaxID=2315608 RepID=A0A386K8H1_9CAUD|nr:hypothetical protein HYP71_gp065 [Arthrobacter phage KBurrousTX]AYD81559.1 hypothetical protein KBurrousTX_65 [Arthrobacter phage KBurrousTX]